MPSREWILAMDPFITEPDWLNIPIKGISIPIMGTKRLPPKTQRRTSLADALFSRTQQSVLGLVFGQPDRSFYATELIAAIGAGSGAVQRELARLEQSGLVKVHRVGTQKHYQANPTSPLFEELCSIAMKTVGLAEPLRQALEPLADRIDLAFVFGSVAKRQDTAASDIDLMIVSDTLTYADVFAALENVSARLGRSVSPTVYSRRDLQRRLKQGSAFATRARSQAKLWLIGSDDDLAA